MRRMVAVVLVWGAVLAGCASHRAEMADRAKAAQKTLIGMVRKDLLLCAGEPLRTEKTLEEYEFLTFAGGGGRSGRNCEVTFTLKEGRVLQVIYHGRKGELLESGAECVPLVERCVTTKR